MKNRKPLFVDEYEGYKPSAEGNKYFLRNGGVSIQRDKNGILILKRAYSAIETEETDRGYEQMRFNINC